MEKLKIILLIGMVCVVSFSALAQKKVPYTFQYQTDSTKQGKLQEVTQVNYPNTSSIRLYFKDTQLGEESYLLLEGSDGTQQKLDAEALKNWDNSSAYFNGGKVKISVYQAAGESQVTFTLKELKVNDGQTDQAAKQVTQARKITTQSASGSNAEEINLAELPTYAAAVGRFTNGVETVGQGWIAANGAIVTTYQFSGDANIEINNQTIYHGFDIIEFNIPPSNPDGSVNHPGPEDQYPLNPNRILRYIIGGNASTQGNWDYNPMKIKSYDGYKVNTLAGCTILEALPNGTGLRPGERIGEYFQVTKHPSGSTMEGRPLQLFHYGANTNGDKTKEHTLQQHSGKARDPNDWLTKVNDKNRFIIFDKGTSRNLYSATWEGAPIVYEGSNVAVGIHTRGGYSNLHEFGTGFRDGPLRQYLNDFFSSDRTYVDQESYWDTGDGKIDKPYHTVADGVQNVVADGIVSIARGSYNESVTINTPMTLKAPVGIVRIGTSQGNNSRRAQVSLPPELFVEDDESALDDFEEEIVEGSSFQSYPNPFTDRTELRYELPEETSVTVKVFNILGKEVNTLVQTQQPAGAHTVVWDGRNALGGLAETGIYIIQLQTGSQTAAVRVIKK